MRNILLKTSPSLAKAVGAAIALGLAGCGAANETATVPGDALIRLSDQFSSDFALVDQNGQPRTDEDFHGKVALVYFGFATCPDVCPLALGTLSAALNELSPKERAQVAPLFITVDPERDTPQALKDYLAFNDGIIGLTGSPEAAEHARTSFKVYARKQKLPESALGYTMDHTSLFYLVDRKGRPQLAIHDTVTPQELAAILRKSLKGRLT
ncbi:MAG: SCO family protein [Pseudomonadota bacterium]|nr:SCO family protein [Pseudomonadota bacterium]